MAYIEKALDRRAKQKIRDRTLRAGRYKEWALKNPEGAKRIQNKANAKRRATPEGRLNGRVSARIWQCLKESGGTKSRRGWEELVGYSLADLRTHLERQFLAGMSWSNMGQWHVDHILPLSTFSFSSPEDPEFRAAWALTNLRPLWASENIRKHSNRTLLI